jgi:hypothetical protein
VRLLTIVLEACCPLLYSHHLHVKHSFLISQSKSDCMGHGILTGLLECQRRCPCCPDVALTLIPVPVLGLISTGSPFMSFAHSDEWTFAFGAALTLVFTGPRRSFA